MKRVKEAVFCPVQALILDHITISLGKFDRSQWVGFEKGWVACWVLLPRRLAVIQPQNSALKTKTTGDDDKVLSGHHQDGTRAGGRESGLSDVHRNNLLLLTLSHPNNLSFYPRGSFSLIWIPAVFFITDSASISVKHFHRVCVCVCV